ncbi:DUF6850 family outer membrane beta-barrel protein [Sphingobacterium anhuiense]|uniref:DUF6850 family outer membrane beta-barrel protein n=1 Tax=Sphingobacterium anhuiense TaxID=493780 RepID=A0ABW5YQA0_9SPHI
MKISSKIVYLTLIAALSGTQLHAQKSPNSLEPSSVSLNESRRLWQHTGVAAALTLDSVLHYSTLYLAHRSDQGDFRRPQQARSANEQTIATRGNLNLGQFYLEGGFKYKRQQLNEVDFNASLIDPYRGMPFLVADTNSSDWRNQHYTLDFAVASPRYKDRWTFGLESQYKASSGAKQRDIRAENYYYSLYLSPSIMYHLGKHHLGTSFIYQDTKEESAQSLVNTYVNQQYYTVMGLGHSIAALGGSGLYNYMGNSRGLGLHYEYSGSVRVLLSGHYKWEVEDVNSSYSSPMPVGSVSRKILSANASLFKEDNVRLHRINATFYQRDMNGIEYVLQRVNREEENYWDILSKDIRSTYRTTISGLNYTFLHKKNVSYKWKFNGGIQYEKIDDRYIIPGSNKKSETFLYQLGTERQILLSSHLEQGLMIGLQTSYRQRISANYHYKGNFPEYPTVTKLENNDLAWMQSDALCLHIPVRYSRQVQENKLSQLYIQAEGSLMKPSSKTFDKRTSYQVSLGINF